MIPSNKFLCTALGKWVYRMVPFWSAERTMMPHGEGAPLVRWLGWEGVAEAAEFHLRSRIAPVSMTFSGLRSVWMIWQVVCR